jgi:hypothetical protein
MIQDALKYDYTKHTPEEEDVAKRGSLDSRQEQLALVEAKKHADCTLVE